MVLFMLRGAFIIIAAAVAVLYVLQFQEQFQQQSGTDPQAGGLSSFGLYAAMLGGAVGLSALIIAVDILTRRKRLAAISGIFLGLIAGLVAAYALSFVVDLVGVYTPIRDDNRPAFLALLQGVKVLIGLITCYVSISLVLQTKDDFRFVIPYVEFAKEVRGNRPSLLDTSVLIDGRILDIVDTGVLQGQLIAPRFVLDELQSLADSSDRLKRARGRRGLDILQKLQDHSRVDTVIDETLTTGNGADQKLIELAEQRQARLMTNDFNLNKVATLRGVDVINLNDLAKALRPVVLPGEEMTVKIVKPGENPAQGVGYLEDGTMVVVENGRDYLGRRVETVVTSTIQTSAGRMIFGRYERTRTDDENPAKEPAGQPAAPAESRTDDRTPPPSAPPTSDSETSEQTGEAAPRRARVGSSSRNPRRSR